MCGEEQESNLKILNVKFEPIRQGKNIVHVKLENTSEQGQAFRIGIYTRSPDYGRNGIGWGTSFSEIIRLHEMRWIRFAFKIQGPITDKTWLRLRFFNPDSQESNERNEHFEQRRYTSGDLEHYNGEQTAVKPASETGHQGRGWAYGSTIVEVYNEQEQLDPYHETTHVLMRPFGTPPALFNEGFAVYMSERLGAYALDDLSGGRATIYERVRELKSKDEWIELEELITYNEIGSLESRPPIAYAEAASFVKFLIDEYGKDKFLRAYGKLKNSNNKIVHWTNKMALQSIYGKQLYELQKEWKKAFQKE